MTEYKNLPENYLLFKKAANRFWPISVLVFMSLVVYSYCTDGFDSAVTALMIFIIVFSISFLMNKKRQRQMYYSYALIVGETGLTRQQKNMPDMNISFSEITAIEEINRSFLIVKGDERNKRMLIWPYVENFDELKAVLETYRPIAPIVYKNIFQKYPLLLFLLLFAACTLVYVSNNKIVVAICAFGFSTYIGWAFYKNHTNRYAATNTKKLAWVMLIFTFFMLMAAVKKLIS
jgi:hypothetical protein